MQIITIDFETYYDGDYSLSKITTEAYVRDPRFEVIGVARKVGDGETVWYSGPAVGRFLAEIDYTNTAILCHNTAFDGAILAWCFGVQPKLWLDSMSMARPFHGTSTGCSLAALAKEYNLPAKGTAVLAAKGKRRKDFSPAELEAYGDYCKHDVDLTYKLFRTLVKRLPTSELRLIDHTIRMFLEPMFELDGEILHRHLDTVRHNKQALLAKLAGGGDSERLKSALMSNAIFADVLRRVGVEPPTKISPTTGKPTYAFAKTDKEFQSLLDHENPVVQNLAAARLGVKSTLEETRTESFIGIAGRGPLPILLNYWGAHTGRFSGGDKINLQNLPRKGALRRAMRAPEGYVVVASDLAQIEARMLAYVAGQEDLVRAFAQGRDVYSDFASEVYGRTITKADETERFIGKTCVAEGTLVLTDSGWKPIETVSMADRVWDGDQWVGHDGVVSNGTKPTLNMCGALLTPDHLCWSGTKWLDAQSVVEDESFLRQVLDTGAENLPSQATSLAHGVDLKPLWLDANVVQKSTESIHTISGISNQLGAIFAQKKQDPRNVIGYTAKQCPMMNTGRGFLIDCLRKFLGVTLKPIRATSIMGNVASLSAKNGEKTASRSLDMFRRYLDGTIQNLKLTASMWTETTNRETYDLQQEAKTCTTSERLLNSKPVYDILNSGSRNRFTILTNAGPIIVHNCILALGYSMSAAKFIESVRVLSRGKILIDEDMAQRVVYLYRNKNFKIPAFWRLCDAALSQMVQRSRGQITDTVMLQYENNKIYMPNGVPLVYHDLSVTTKNFVYKARNKPQHLYGGKLTENIIQALARQVIADMMVKIGERYRPALQVHDEIVYIVPEKESDFAVEFIRNTMSSSPEWAPGLPIACEIGVGRSYGECK